MQQTPQDMPTLDAHTAFLLAIYFLVKSAGTNNTFSFPVADVNLTPKDGVWTFGALFDEITQTITIQLVEGWEQMQAAGLIPPDIEELMKNESKSSELVTTETEQPTLREVGVREESPSSDEPEATDS